METFAQLPPSRTLTRRHHASIACKQCQAGKAKCIGGRPCQRCSSKGLECVFDESTDRRRKDAIRLKNVQGGIFADIFNVLRSSSEEEAMLVLQLVRSDRSVQELRDALSTTVGGLRSRDSLQPLQSDASAAEAAKSETDRRRRAQHSLDIIRISDNPIHRVSAAPWTDVTTDDELVSHLISVWWEQHLPLHCCMDRDLFIRDMQLGDISATFCSPFLVNAILAMACTYSEYPETRPQNGRPTQVAQEFLLAAREHLEGENGRLSLPTVQGLELLAEIYGNWGRDRVGWNFSKLAGSNFQEFADQNRGIEEPDADDDDQDMHRAIDYTSWGVFAMTSISSAIYHKRPILPIPRREQPIKLSPYPELYSADSQHSEALMKMLYSLGIINSKLAEFKQALRDQGLNIDQMTLGIERLNREFRELWSQLPQDTNPSGCKLPYILVLHQLYHVAFIQLYQPLRCLSRVQHHSAVATAQHTASMAALEIASLTSLYRQKWSLLRLPAPCAHCSTTGLVVLFDDLAFRSEQQQEQRSRSNKSTTNPSEFDEAIIELTHALRSIANRIFLARAAMQFLLQILRRSNISLPEKAAKLFDDFHKENWTEEDRMAISSMYPNLSVSNTTGVDLDMGMDALLMGSENIESNSISRPRRAIRPGFNTRAKSETSAIIEDDASDAEMSDT